MPIFEYVCADCGKEFEAVVYGSAEPQCPGCQGSKLEKQLSTFSVSSKAAASPRPSGGCGSCGDPRGPGACRLD